MGHICSNNTLSSYLNFSKVYSSFSSLLFYSQQTRKLPDTQITRSAQPWGQRWTQSLPEVRLWEWSCRKYPQLSMAWNNPAVSVSKIDQLAVFPSLPASSRWRENFKISQNLSEPARGEKQTGQERGEARRVIKKQVLRGDTTNLLSPDISSSTNHDLVRP